MTGINATGSGEEPEQSAARHRHRRSGGHRRRAPRRRPLRALLVVGAAFVALVVVAAGVAYVRFGADIKTFDASGLSKSRPPAPVLDSENILLIGSDSRAGDNKKLGGSGELVGRSDTTLLVHVYADHKHAVAVSIPRDTLTTIPSCLLPDGSWTQPQPDTMFNAAFSVGQTEQGNPACTQNTVEAMTGLKIDHTVVAGFSGFAALTKAVGGVRVCLPNPVYQGDLDPNLHATGKLLFPAGMQRLSGVRALQYVRIRHGLGDGSDIGRIHRQQAFLASVVMKVRRQGLTTQHLLPIVDAATANLTFDPTLGTPTKLLSFAMSLRDIEPKDIDFVTVPWQYDGPRVRIVEPDADRLFAALRADQPLVGKSKKPSPSTKKKPAKVDKTVPVSVYNGTTITGLAGRTAKRLEKVGFTVADVANAPSSDHARSVVQYSAEYAAQAQALATRIDATLQKVAAPGVSLVLGREHTWLRPDGTVRPVKLPTSVTANVRKANTNPCSKLT